MNPRLRIAVALSALLAIFGTNFESRRATASESLVIEPGQRIVMVGGSIAERMNLYGNFETQLQRRFAEKRPLFRNFGWPADEVGNQQRPGNYTLIDDPLEVFSPDLFLCFFGFNESFAGSSPEAISSFIEKYRGYIAEQTKRFTRDGRQPRFVLVTPIAFESTGDPLHPTGETENANLSAYADAIVELGKGDDIPVVELWSKTMAAFSAEPGAQYTINGVHLNEAGDELVSKILDESLFGPSTTENDPVLTQRLREAINDKSWLHQQDYRMLNGWYVYGGRRTWDTETFPTEYRKIREMVAVRDRYVWDLAAGRSVPDQPDDSATGEVFTPETMFGSRDENFRAMREPKQLTYPTPEESIAQMQVPKGFEVKLFASEREFPELANPTQLNFDNRGRLWVSCMVNYPQWLPGGAKPNDRLLIIEDTDGDGLADSCKTFYDKLICPTGFEFINGGVLVVDEPRIIFLKDTDGDDRADEVTQIIDGIATDDTHHAMGAWEYSHGGLLHMLEGVSMSTTLETPWGPFRNHGPSGAYVWDPQSLKVRHFRTPSYGNPWCLVFDRWGNGIIGDGTNAQQHWASLLSGAAVNSRRSVQPIFNNEGMRPAVGNDFLISRHFPDDVQGQFIYACVINMHGLPRFSIWDSADTAGLEGKRIENLLDSTDMFFRPVDPMIGPDGALWFGDWCNALIGHMQYSQRDPNRDHEHGRVYRLVHQDKPLLEPVTQAGKSIDELLTQLNEYEPRTRYRARRELRDRESSEVLAAVKAWIKKTDDPNQWCEALWLQEAFHQVDPELVNRILDCDDFHARAAAIHVVGNQSSWIDDPYPLLWRGISDKHPRVRLEAMRAASFLGTLEATKIVLAIANSPRDMWIDYVLEHTLAALQPAWIEAISKPELLAGVEPSSQKLLVDYLYSTGPGAAVFIPLRTVANVESSESAKKSALRELVTAGGGSVAAGAKVFERTCSACHLHGTVGKVFGPTLTDVGARMSREQLIRSIVWPNEEIAKGFETVSLITLDGVVINGFVLSEDKDSITLGIANGKTEKVNKDDIDVRKEMKASSMPEGLLETIAPGEFLDLMAFLQDGWVQSDPAADRPLRKKGPWVEVSRGAGLLLGKDFPGNYSGEASKFLAPERIRQFDFAFHSPNQNTPDASVVIRLPATAEIRQVELDNRLDKQFHDRADGLAMWISDDGKEWREVWKSDKPMAKWSIELPPGTEGRYVKLGLTKPGIFHLYHATFYGKSLPEKP